MNDPMTLARQIATKKEINEAAEAWIISAFSAWWRDGKGPERLAMFLRLPTASRSAIAERDHWLGVSCKELQGDFPASQLAAIVKDFMKNDWPIWRCSSQPPADADPVLAALFFAADSGATMDLGKRQWRNIVRKSFPE